MKFLNTLQLLTFAARALGDAYAAGPASESTAVGFVGSSSAVVVATWRENLVRGVSSSLSKTFTTGASYSKTSTTVASYSKTPTTIASYSKTSTTSVSSGKTIATWTASSYGQFTAPPKYKPTSVHMPTLNSTCSAADYAKTHSNCTNGPNSRGCWGGGFDINTNYEVKWPNTGRVVKYQLLVQNTTLSPDGTPKQMLVVNGQYPAPLIEANWGDILEITVKNELDYNGTSMHWHGVRQLNSNPQDGVNGITECPLAPGDSKTYQFQATQYGTTWYHSHFSAQYGGGVNGPLVIHGPAAADYDIDIGTIQVSELYNLTVYQEDWFAERTGPPTAANYLLNGNNVKVDGSAGTRAKFNFTPGKKHLLRLINTSVDNHFKMTLDNHNMTVIAADFVPINPYNTSVINVNIGQRYDVIIEANQPVSNYWLRAICQTSCGQNQNSGLGTSNGIVSYAGANASLPTSTYSSYADACIDEPASSLVPVVPKPVNSTGFAAQASALPVSLEFADITGEGTVFRWTLNQISQIIDWANPTIAQVVAGNDSFPTVKDVITLPNANVWTFWIIQNQFFVPHPMHLHGHDFSILGQGLGTFDPSNSTMMGQLNFVNPPRRDVAILLASGWTVIAFQTDNPGAWLMHCHIAWHVGEGLSLQFLELPGQVKSEFSSTVTANQFQNNCKNWTSFAGSAANIFQQTDSGLKKRMGMTGGTADVKRHLSRHRRHVARHS